MKISIPQKKIAIKLKNITKTYYLKQDKPTFVEQLIRKSFLTKNEPFYVFKKFNLTVYKGERLGIMGKNGAGKTTLLKIIAGITQPDSGTVSTKGKVVSLIDISAGFHPELSGAENIYLNGLVLGMSKRQIRAKYDEIINFADIGKFIDSPMYTYSEGMKLRLGFSVAIHTDPDILLLDEGILVGDEDFQYKIKRQLDTFFSAGKTAIIVSHWKEFLDRNTTRIMQM